MRDAAWLSIPFGVLIVLALSGKKARWSGIGGIFKRDRRTGQMVLVLTPAAKKSKKRGRRR